VQQLFAQSEDGPLGTIALASHPMHRPAATYGRGAGVEGRFSEWILAEKQGDAVTAILRRQAK